VIHVIAMVAAKIGDEARRERILGQLIDGLDEQAARRS
jgi:hypothetical protein